MLLDAVKSSGMAGLRERKKRETRQGIRDSAMRLFADHGFARTTVDDIAAAANVSRATVFTYFPTKEEIVFGDAASAVDALGAALRGRADGTSTVATVRAWLAELTGWLEPELLLQLRLGREAPGVAARRLQLYREIEGVIAESLEAELGPDRRLAAGLAAASLIGGLNAVEEAAATQMAEGGRALSDADIDRLLDMTVAFVEAGLSAVAAPRTQ